MLQSIALTLLILFITLCLLAWRHPFPDFESYDDRESNHPNSDEP